MWAAVPGRVPVTRAAAGVATSRVRGITLPCNGFTNSSLLRKQCPTFCPVQSLRHFRLEPSVLASAVHEQTICGQLEDSPDVVVPASSYMTWKRGDSVKLRVAHSGPGSEKPISIMTFIRQTVERLPNYSALVSKDAGGSWKSVSYEQYYDTIRCVARGFIELGLEPQQAVGILGFNSPEWNIACFATIFAGAYATGIYLTNSPDACHYVANHGQCQIIVVDDDTQLNKILSIKDRLPHLKAIIQYRGEKSGTKIDGVYSWPELLAIGSQSLERELENRIQGQAPNKCCTVVYTSGTTGDPKGAMLSHDNIVWTSKQCRERLGVNFGDPWRIVSYLPLSHVAAQISDIFSPIVIGATVYFAEPDALKGSLGKTLKEVKPNHFFAVPRVWEKMEEAITAAGKNSGPLKRKVISIAKEASLQGTRALMSGQKIPISSQLANKIIMRKVHEALGLDKCDVCVSAAAPISRRTLDFCMSLGIPLVEVYGMTEASGPHTIGLRFDNAVGSVGREITGAHTEIHDPDKNGIGELLLQGRNVFMGYLDMKELTLQSFGGPLGTYYHSGDLGRRDERGFLYVSGRLKEILITSGGENIPSVNIELAIKERLRMISNCMLIGDGKNYLTMLLTIKTNVDLDTLIPLDSLSPDVIQWCRALGSNASTVNDVTNDVVLMEEIKKGIDDVNERAVSNAQRVNKWMILSTDFSIAGGELGPTLKVRRHVILKKYAKLIDSMYIEN